MMLVSRRFDPALAPVLPHGERPLPPGKNGWPEDLLPLPKCLDCKGSVYYSACGWRHHDEADHEARPNERK